MLSKEYILECLSKIDKSEFSILELGLFGSYASGKNGLDSDIDILVKLELKKGMYENFCRLQEFLENLFGKKVDLIEKGTFDYRFKNKEVAKYKEEVKKEILESVIYV